MTPVPRRLHAAVLFVVAAAVAGVSAGTFTVVGPRTFTRATGAPVTEQVRFSAQPSSGYVLHVESDGVASAVITLNGATVLGPSDFRPSVTALQRTVTLPASNVLTVELRSKPGSWVRIWIAGSDNDAPVIRAVASPAANAAGWNNGNVTVTFTCADALSGIAQCPAPVTVATEGASQVVSGEAVDNTGNRATASVMLNIDKTAPAIVATPSPTANAGGWHNSDVTVGFACSDALSGVASCANSVVVTGSGSALPAAGTAVDRAGNTASVSVSLNIDRTPPQITARLSAPPNAAGWHHAPVTVEFVCADDGAGVASCPPPVAVAGEGAGQVVKGLARDRAGNEAEASLSVNLDLTAPRITVLLSMPANDAGWHSGDVTVSFACDDALSGVTECPAPRTVSAEGVQDVEVSSSDRAGLTATVSTAIRIDRTPPTITAAISPLPNAAGWHSTPVTVTFACSDAGSGVADCPAPVTLGTADASQVVTGSAVDRAGNRATADATASIDLTPPSIQAIVSTAGATNGEVTVSFECNDALSGIATCPAAVTVTLEGLDQLVDGVATDNAGNSARASASVSIDRTRPTIVASVAPAPNGAGWHASPQVVVSFTCGDTGSGVVACPEPVIVTGEGAAQQVSGTVRDRAGNAATATVEISLDRTAPAITAQPSVNGWTSAADVTVRFLCSDALSGIEYCSDPIVVTAEGAHEITGAARDRAGNSASAPSAVQIDRTAPEILAAADRAPNAAGWYNAPATVTFTCSDAGSGIASCPPPSLVAADGAGPQVTGTATDRAGNQSSTSLAVNLDTVPPVLRATTTPGANSDVLVSFECTDTDGSGIATCPAQVTVTADGSSRVTGEALDVAGNRATVEITVVIDRSPLTITARASRLPNAQGWYNAPVRIDFECVAGRSAVPSCPAPIDVASDGAGQVISGTAVDAEGNRASASVTLNMDTTAPSIQPRLTPATAWANGPVVVTFDCVDPLSGVIDCTSGATVSTDGAAQVVTGQATDRAGNVATTAAHVNIDRGAPVIRAVVTPAPNAQGWHTTSPTVTFECTDTLSGVASCPDPVAVSAQGADQVITGTARDAAGNTATATATLSVDLDGPSLLLSSPAPGTVFRDSAAAISGTASDTLSGLLSVTCGGTAAAASGGTFLCSATLTSGANTIEVVATDHAGNVTRSSLALTFNGNTTPVARAGGPYSGETGTSIRFDGSESSDAEGQALTFRWAFGDGATATGQSASHVFTEPGSFAVELTVTDTEGASNTSSSTVTVTRANRSPVADAGGPYTGDAARTITLTAAASTDPDGDALTYAWTFGDGSSASGAVVHRAYTTPGSFTARVTVTDARGASDSATAQVTVRAINQRPTARIGGPYNAEAGQSILFSGTGSDPDNDPLTYGWAFSDGGVASGASVSHAFAASGTFTATLTVSDGRGGSDAATTQVAVLSVNRPPVARIQAPAGGEAAQPMAFNAAGSTDPDDDALTYAWTFGDGRSATGVAPNHAYQAAGTYAVGLTVVDSRGASSQAAASITIDAASTVNRPAVARVGGPYVGEVNLPIAFSAAGTSDPDGDAITYAWNFGDGNTGSGAATSHAFLEPRAYVVTVTVTDSHGASDSASVSATVGAQADRAPPILSLHGPRFVLPGTRVRVYADASDNVGVMSVTFAVDGAATQPLAAPPYQHEVAVPPVAAPGSIIVVRATARDAAGNQSAADIALTITAEPDNENPTVFLNTPASAAPGTTIRLSASAADNDAVASVTFTVAGVVTTDTEAPYETAYAIPADALTGSAIQVSVQATDQTGNRASASGAVAITDVVDTLPPMVHLTAPATIQAGGTISLSATATDNTGVAAVIFYVDGARVATLTSAPYSASYAVPSSAVPGMLFRLEARAIDFAGLDAGDVRSTEVAAAAAAGAFVIGEVYDDATGLPLAGATVSVVGSTAEPLVADERGRFAVSAASGDIVLRIAHAGYTTVDRRVAAVAGVRELVDARLTPRAAAVPVTPVLGAELHAGSALLIVAPGSLAAAQSLSFTAVGAQGLAGELPPGWSPVAVVDVAPAGVTFGVPAIVRVPMPSNGGAALTLVTWDADEGAWRAVAFGADGQATLDASVDRSGQFAWIRPDVVPAAPPQPAAGQLVAGVANVDVPQDVSIAITPDPKVIFYQPGVRAAVGGVITIPAPLPSGTRLWARISESYRFFSGAEMYLDPTVQDIFFYQSLPGGSQLSAAFPATPSRTFEALTLERGVIGIDIYVPAADGARGAVVSPSGGTVSLQTGERLDFPEGSTAAPFAASLRRLDAGELGAPLAADFAFLGAVDVTLSAATIERAGVLSMTRPASLAAGAQVLLARLATLQDRTRLVLVAIGRIDGDRLVADAMLPLNRIEMEGVRTSGRYVFVKAVQPVGFVAGRVIDTANVGVPGALVTTETLPIVALSRGSDGRYVAAGRLSTLPVTALDVHTADRGTGTVTLAAAGEEAALDLRLVAEAPRVTSATPAAGATGVAQSTAAIVIFSEPIDPTSLASRVSLSASATAVQGAITLSGGNTILTFRPAVALDPDTTYTLAIDGGITDVTGQPMGTPFALTFTTLDTTAPPPPAAGTISATIPEGGNTTVRGTQGTAGLHDTVSIENVTRGTSLPVLLDPNGGFVTLVQASPGDQLRLKIVDASGNETTVDLPTFTRQNEDGSISGVVGSSGGRVNGPNGTAVMVPEGSLPDGTIVTVNAVPEAAFPVQLTAEEKTVFPYAGGVRVDFGGATPRRYVNVSVAPQAGDTRDGQWIVAQAIDVAGQQVLNAVDTAKLIDGSVRTSSLPCPGVLAAGTYGIFRSDRPIGLAFGQMYSSGNYDGLRMSVGIVNDPLAGIAVPFPVYAWEEPRPVCLPVLTGRVTVGPNTTRFAIKPGAITAADREIVIRNVDAGGRESHFRRELLEYAFEVVGTLSENFAASVVSTAGVEVNAGQVDVRPGPAGKVIVALQADTIHVAIASVIIRNTSRVPALVTTFPVTSVAFEVTAGGGLNDFYWITAIDADGVSRHIDPADFTVLPSAHGPGNMLARAQVGTIDPTFDEAVAAHPGTPPVKWRTRVDLLTIEPVHMQEVGRLEVPAAKIVNGGFSHAFDGQESFHHAIEVIYNTGETDYVRIPKLNLIVTNPQTGQVIKTIEVPAPPKDEPIGVGPITNDAQAPLLTGSPSRLNSFDPSQPLTFTFSEAMDANSIRQSMIVERITAGGTREKVLGVWRVYNGNRTATFVPQAPLRIGEEYSVTLVGNDSLAHSIAPGALPVTDFGGNAIATMRMQVKTFTPRLVTSVLAGAGGRPMSELFDIQIRHMELSNVSRTFLFATTNATDGPKMIVFDATDAETTKEIGIGYGGRTQKGLTLVNDIGLNGNPPLTFRKPQSGPTPACGPVGPSFTGDLALTAGYNLDFSFVQAWYPGGPTAAAGGGFAFTPCLLTSKLLTANPETLNSFTSHGTMHAFGSALAVAAIRHEQGLAAFTAVRDVGLFATDMGPEIPEVEPAARERTPFVSGDYYDVVAFRDRLLTANNGGQSLDIFDPNLAPLGSAALPGGARHIVVAENYGVDEDGDGFIRAAEIRNLAFVSTRSCAGGPGCNAIQIVDLKNFSNPTVIGFVPMPAYIFSLDIDPAKHRLFATGYTDRFQHTSSFFMIDISQPAAFAADADLDGVDDRIVWKKEFPSGLNGARIDTARGLAYIPVIMGGRTGRLEVWAIYDNCCDLAVDFTAGPAKKESGVRSGLLNKERQALSAGIAAGLAKAATTCTLNTATVSILEQGSGACLWRDKCDANYQPGLSDHDFEIFVPLAAWNTTLPSGKTIATCTADVLTETFTDPVTGQPKSIALPTGASMSFEDITFFPEVREHFESARFDTERPVSSGSDAVGDMGLGRRSLLLKWLLEGEYVSVGAVSLGGRPLADILADLKNNTRIARLEGYEWSVLQDFNLVKSKAFVRVAGAAKPASAFHKLFMNQLHGAGKAGIRATMARLAADTAGGAMVLDVTRQQYNTNACYEITATVTNPLGWPEKPCSSFEEYVASAAARTLRQGLSIFTRQEVVEQAHRFFKVKADLERITAEPQADAFVALVAKFIANAKVLTQPIYNQTILTDPDAAERVANMGFAQTALSKALKEVKLPLTPHVSSRGFRNGTGLRVAMYTDAVAGGGTMAAETTVDLAGGDDRYLAYLRNADGTLALSSGRARPIFELKVDVTQRINVPQAVSFVIDLPDRRMKESNRQNNVGGFFYYVLDRATGATPAVPPTAFFPLPDSTLLDPSPECYEAPALTTTQQVKVGGQLLGDEVVLGRREAVTIYLTVQNMSSQTLNDVIACSNISNTCETVGTLVAGEFKTIKIDYVTPDQDVYVDGTPSAFSPQSGVLTGASTRMIVSGDTYVIQPMMDEAVVTAIDPELLNVQAGGRAIRHYRVVGKRSGLPRPGMTFTGELEGIFGGVQQKQPLALATNAKGEICTPSASGCTGDNRGLEIPYQASMLTNTTYFVTLKKADGVDIGAANFTRFTFDVKDRAYSQSYSVGGQIGGGVKILGGVDLDVEDGFELTKSGNFFTGPTDLGLSVSRQITFKRKAEAKLGLAFKTPIIAATAEIRGGVSASSPVTNTASFTFPYHPNASPLPGADPFILEFDEHCAIATITTNQLANRNPVINKIADLLRESPCGDPNRFATSHSVKGGASLTGSGGADLTFQSPLFGRIGNTRPTLGVSFGLSATASVSVEHETSVTADGTGVTPSGFKTSVGLFGQIDLTASLGLSLDDTIQAKRPGAPPAEPAQEREDFFAVKSIKKAIGVTTTRAIGGSFGFDIEQDADGVVSKVSLNFVQPKKYGWTTDVAGDGTGLNLGSGSGTSISFSVTRTDDKVLVLQRLANLQALANMVSTTGSMASLLTLTPTKIDDEIAGLRLLLFDTVSTYKISQSDGSGVELPFGFEGQLAKVGLSAKLSFKGDSKMSWVTERGINFKGSMLPLQAYTRDMYLPATDLRLTSFIAQMWESVNASFGPASSYVSATITPGSGPTVLRSPNTAIMTIDGSAVSDPFEAVLYSYKFREIPGPVADAPRLPSDTAGPAGEPHYGVGGFHHFGPDEQALGAPTQLVIDYKDPDIAGLDETTFAMYGWNETSSDWDYIGGVVDPTANTVTAHVDRMRAYTLAPAMPARKVTLTASDLGQAGDGETATRRFTVTSGPLVLNNGQPVADGTLFTVRSVSAASSDETPFGTILTPDADGTRANTQIAVVNGRLQFDVELSSPNRVFIPGRVIVHSTTGTAYGDVTLTNGAAK